MTVRHVTSRDNVDAGGYLVDPARVHHASLRLGRIDAIGGPVDPLTHLNLDFPDHSLDTCLVAERLERGAAMVREADGQVVRARLSQGARTALGRVDLGRRRGAWLAAMRERREEIADARR